MKTNFKSLLIASALITSGALSLPIASYAADGDTVSTKMSDSVITTKIKAEFAKDKLVSAANVTVETDGNGLVQLSGTAKSKSEAEQAVQLAKKVKGVTAVKSDIVVTE